MTSAFRSDSRTQAGVTVTELLVVIVVIAVLCGFALMQSGGVDDQLKRQNSSQALKVAFERARFDSVKRRADGGNQARVTITPLSFTLRTYSTDANGASVSQDHVTNLPAGITFKRYDGGALTSLDVAFNMRGEVVSPSDAQFYVCNGACSGGANDSNADLVIVTPTGTVNLLSGSSSLPSFGVPTISPISNSANINPDTVFP